MPKRITVVLNISQHPVITHISSADPSMSPVVISEPVDSQRHTLNLAVCLLKRDHRSQCRVGFLLSGIKFPSVFSFQFFKQLKYFPANMGRRILLLCRNMLL